MNGMRLFLAGRGLHAWWLVAQLGIVVIALCATGLAAAPRLNPDMLHGDESQLVTSLGMIASSALCSWLLVPEHAWRERTASISLTPAKGLLIAICGLVLSWPWLIPGVSAPQHVAAGGLLFGTSGLIAARWPSAVSVPHAAALLLAMVPKLVSPAWNPFTPTQRSLEFIGVSVVVALAGACVTVWSQHKPAHSRAG